MHDFYQENKDIKMLNREMFEGKIKGEVRVCVCQERKILKYTSENKSAWHLLANKSPCGSIKKKPKATMDGLDFITDFSVFT